MIHIAVCEDNAEDLSNLSRHIAAYRTDTLRHGFDVTTFDCPSKLREEIDEGLSYSIFFLDIMMPEINGIELGKTIRQLSSEAIIVYVTSSSDYALDAFGVLAQRYLMKPLLEEQVHEALDFALDTVSAKQEKIFTMKTSDGVIGAPFKDILYAECASRTIVLHCTNDKNYHSIFIRENFESEIGPLLSDPSFVQTHKSFAVNMEHVERMQTQNLLMTNGALIPIARKRQGEVKRSYLKFLAHYQA